MSKKHFIQFAAKIKVFVERGQMEIAKEMAIMVILIASEENPRFDHNRFLAACGL